MRKLVCTVVGCGASNARWLAEPYIRELAFEAGAIAARADLIVLTGGRGGVMSEAARGARAQGGLTVGILPTAEVDDANEHIDIVIPTGIGYARNAITALSGDIMIAVPGGQGTLQEMSFAVDFKRPVLSWDSWSIFPDVPVVPHNRPDLVEEWVLAQVKKLRGLQR